jgi:hypothetical protein
VHHQTPCSFRAESRRSRQDLGRWVTNARRDKPSAGLLFGP